MAKSKNYDKKCRDCMHYVEDPRLRAQGKCIYPEAKMFIWKRNRYGRMIACQVYEEG